MIPTHKDLEKLNKQIVERLNVTNALLLAIGASIVVQMPAGRDKNKISDCLDKLGDIQKNLD